MKKIADLPEDNQRWSHEAQLPCMHPEHNPPMNIVLPPGIYEHECPGCGHKQHVTIQRGAIWRVQNRDSKYSLRV